MATAVFISFAISVLLQRTAAQNIINITEHHPYYCYKNSSCAGAEIHCGTAFGSCLIRCEEEYSCNGTRFEAGSRSYLLLCSAEYACNNAIINNPYEIRSQAPNALKEASITCRSGEQCELKCSEAFSCSGTEINGADAYSLDIDCSGAYQSCHDMTLHCPYSVLSGSSSPMCSMTGDTDHQYDVHSNLNIYTYFGWTDIEFINYNAYTLGGKMHCNHSALGGSDSCDIEYGIWDCKDPSSLCRSLGGAYPLDLEYHHCDEVGSCSGEDIQCQPANTSILVEYVSPVCNVLCSGDGSCVGSNITCHTDRECHIVCSGEGSCVGITVSASGGGFLDGDMEIVCGKDGNGFACANSTFNSMPAAVGMRVNTFGTYNLMGTTVYGTDTFDALWIQCNYNQSCKGAVIRGNTDGDELVIYCNGEYDSCSDMKVYCPHHVDPGDVCEIRGESVDRNRNLQLFCVDGWDDIDVSDWSNKVLIDSDINNGNTMNCGTNFESSCAINEDWNCKCPPTSAPTENPTGVPTPIPTLIGVIYINESILLCNDTSCQNNVYAVSYKGNEDFQLGCLAENSCENLTIFTVEDDMTIHLYCFADGACKNVDVHDAGYIKSTHRDALEGAMIECADGVSCYLGCTEDASCHSVTIVGTQSSSLRVVCDEYGACLDMTVHCPPGNIYTAYCTILGNDALGQRADVHNEFNIYAPNGWGDIAFDDYKGYTLSGKMYCGGSDSTLLSNTEEYECDIQYGIWDCVDISSPCRNQTWLMKDREYHICDSDNPCRNKKIKCNHTTDTSSMVKPWPPAADAACILHCSGHTSCESLEFICGADKPCHIICSGEESCNKTDIWDGNDKVYEADREVDVICGREGNHGSCKNAIFNLIYSASLSLYSFGEEALFDAVVIGPETQNTLTHVECNHNTSCMEAQFIHYIFNGDLWIQCNGEYDSCADMDVACPFGLCKISGESIDRNHHLFLGADRGWNGIDVSEWVNKQLVTTANGTVSGNRNLNNDLSDSNEIHCGWNDYDYWYDSFCEINEFWNCSCGSVSPQPTRQPTFSSRPTAEPTPSPTSEPGSKKNSDDIWLIVGIIFIVICLMLICLVGIFVWRNNNESKDGYHTTSTSMDETELGQTDNTSNE